VSLTQSGVTMGTPLYMSPEQVEGRPLDCRTDIYSFGVTCYHMLAGHPPFNGETAFEVAIKHVRDEPPALAQVRPDLPEALCAIVHKMMAKAPENRHQTGRELLRDVLKLREAVGPGATAAVAAKDVSVDLVPLPSSGGLPAAPGGGGWRWWAALVVASLLLAAGAGAGYAWWKQREGEPPPSGGRANDPGEAAVLDTQRKEQAMRDLVEDHLNPQNGFKNIQTGLQLSLELGLFYLNSAPPRLKDADRLFERLEGLDKQAHPYYVLGHLGRGVTLSLSDRAKESNQHFKDIAALNLFRQPKKDEPPPRRGPEIAIFPNTELRYWLAVAVHRNKDNGVPDADVPPYFKQFLQRPPVKP
jgi:serine/threonine-protein kinase